LVGFRVILQTRPNPNVFGMRGPIKQAVQRGLVFWVAEGCDLNENGIGGHVLLDSRAVR